MIPISENISIVVPGITSPRSAGPSRIPAEISPTRDGNPALSASSPSTFALIRMRMISARGPIGGGWEIQKKKGTGVVVNLAVHSLNRDHQRIFYRRVKDC
jgi:hypothetical protein